MKTASIREIREELNLQTETELLQLCLRLARFKKENKELLTYLLFEANSEDNYIQTVQKHMDESFQAINTNNYYYIKKSVRKILRDTKKFIRYSQKKETEVELLLYFCAKLKHLNPSIRRNKTLRNLYERQLALIRKKIGGLHEDLQYDFKLEIEKLPL